MLGLLFLCLIFGVGWAACSIAFPDLHRLAETGYDKRKITLSPYMILLPVWFSSGTLILAWGTYILASIFKDTAKPLIAANAIVMPAGLLFILAVLWVRILRNKANKPKAGLQKAKLLCSDKRTVIIEIIFIAAVYALAAVLMWTTFYVRSGQLHIGVSVFSDFSPHIGMIRSFSYGNNFPTSYSHYGGAGIRYHFMFQFLVANLEFLGLRIDYAFNLPSIISFMSAFMMLYVLALKITGKRAAGFISCLLFAFRSSPSLMTYLASIPKGRKIFDTLKENTSFIGYTPNEDWGLWNLNVYCNQRHLALGLTVMLFILILFLPRLFDMFESVSELGHNIYMTRKNTSVKKERFKRHRLRDIPAYIRLVFFTKDGWRVEDYRTPIAAGLMLGSLSFFHGSAVIGCILVLFIAAVLSKRRLEYVITAAITAALSIIQTGYFIKESAVSPKLLFGFIAENRTFFGAASYLGRLTGILPLVLLAAMCLEKGARRYLMAAFAAPLIFAFTVSLTVDVTVNHKYIMMSCIMLGIFAAALLIRMFERKDIWVSLATVFLLIALTSTGVYDFYTVINKNKREYGIVLEMDNELTDFVRDNSTSQDLFLTAGTNYAINQVVFGGAILYQGHQYYAWSAGYDTYSRDIMVRRMYEASSPGELNELVKENNIRFIVVEYANRISTDYMLNEDNIKASYECVYSEGEGEYKTSIYDTQKPIYK